MQNSENDRVLADHVDTATTTGYSRNAVRHVRSVHSFPVLSPPRAVPSLWQPDDCLGRSYHTQQTPAASAAHLHAQSWAAQHWRSSYSTVLLHAKPQHTTRGRLLHHINTRM